MSKTTIITFPNLKPFKGTSAHEWLLFLDDWTTQSLWDSDHHHGGERSRRVQLYEIGSNG